MEMIRKRWIGTVMRSKLWVLEQVRKCKEDERGATDFVAIIVIIVIILFIAFIFRERLAKAVRDVFDQLDLFIGGGE